MIFTVPGAPWTAANSTASSNTSNSPIPALSSAMWWVTEWACLWMIAEVVTCPTFNHDYYYKLVMKLFFIYIWSNSGQFLHIVVLREFTFTFTRMWVSCPRVLSCFWLYWKKIPFYMHTEKPGYSSSFTHDLHWLSGNCPICEYMGDCCFNMNCGWFGIWEK